MAAEEPRRTATMAPKLEDILNKLLVADNAVIQEVSAFINIQEESDVPGGRKKRLLAGSCNICGDRRVGAVMPAGQQGQ